MKRALIAISIIIANLSSLCLSAQNASAFGANAKNEFTSLADVIESVNPAVVNISSTQVINSRVNLNEDGPMDFFDLFERDFGDRGRDSGERKRKTQYLGSGFIIDPSGYIVTNYHVIEKADEIEVSLNNDDESSYKAKIIGRDKKTDLTLLKIETKTELPYLEFGNSDEARVGDRIIAIGSPFGLNNTVTSGIISAKSRHLVNQSDDFIQVDAAMNRGNSGGPVSNMDGKVIGVSTAIVSPSGGSIGLGFVVPSNVVYQVVTQLKSHGEVIRGWLGVSIQPVHKELADSLGLDSPRGALIAEVLAGSPAEKAGLKAGDIILKFDGITVQNSNKLSKVVATTTINKQVNLEVFRNKKIISLQATIVKLESDDDDQENAADSEQFSKEEDKGDAITVLDMKIRNINDMLRKKYQISQGINGALVTNVKPDGIAATAKIRTGDVIVQVNQDKISSTQDFKEKIEELKNQKSKGAALLIANHFGSYFVFLSFE